MRRPARRANKRGVEQPLSPVTNASLLGSAVAGLAFIGLGAYGAIATERPWLFCFTLIILGVIAVGLAARAFRGRRAPWAFLIAIWGMVAFTAFFTAPKVLSLDKLEQVTVDLELKHGRDKAVDIVADDNLRIRAVNLGMCVLFAAPFAALCAGLARGRRDFERTV
jgi:hypothetical protein